MKLYKLNILSLIKGKTEVQQVLGSKPSEYQGIKYFVNKAINNDGYVCTSFDAGLTFGAACNTTAKAVETMKENIDKNGIDKIKSIIETTIETYDNKGISFPLNTDELIPADILYLQHVNTGNVIQSYENKKGYYVITKEKYEIAKSINNLYFRHIDSGVVNMLPKARIIECPDILEKVQDGWQEISKQEYISSMIFQCKQRLQKSIDSNNIGDILSILNNNDNKYSIKAMSEIAGVSLDKSLNKRMKQVKEWLGERYIKWEADREIEAEHKRYQKEHEAEVKTQKATEEAKESFMDGKSINPEQFVLLCNSVGIKLPLKTHGWINKALNDICVVTENNRLECHFHYYVGHKESTVIKEYAIQLYNTLATVDKFFSKEAI